MNFLKFFLASIFVLFFGSGVLAASINDYTLLIGSYERNYREHVIGVDFWDAELKTLPLLRDEPNYLTIEKRGDEFFSKEIVLFYPKKRDSDNDGLSDVLEIKIGSNPNKSDSDGDGLSDSEELIIWGKDVSSDFDQDGLINILDSDALGAGLRDIDNPDIKHFVVVVVNSENETQSIISFFNFSLKNKIIFNDDNCIKFSWLPNEGGVSGYYLFYREKGLYYYNGKGLDQGDSPIETGSTMNKDGRVFFLVSGANPDLLYDFAASAHQGGVSGPLCPSVILLAVSCIHRYPVFQTKQYKWVVPDVLSFFKVNNRGHYRLIDVLIDGKSQGSLETLEYKCGDSGHEIIFVYK